MTRDPEKIHEYAEKGVDPLLAVSIMVGVIIVAVTTVAHGNEITYLAAAAFLLKVVFGAIGLIVAASLVIYGLLVTFGYLATDFRDDVRRWIGE